MKKCCKICKIFDYEQEERSPIGQIHQLPRVKAESDLVWTHYEPFFLAFPFPQQIVFACRRFPVDEFDKVVDVVGAVDEEGGGDAVERARVLHVGVDLEEVAGRHGE